MGMGGNGNGNGFMGMGGNGNRNSHSRTPLVFSVLIDVCCQINVLTCHVGLHSVTALLATKMPPDTGERAPP